MTRDFGKWSQGGVPHRGWSCIDIQDVGEPSHLCEMCETQVVRYVHTMEHPNYADTLDVGCVCCNWLKREWHTSYSGNEYINTDGVNVVIFRQGEFWSGRVEHRGSGRKMFAQLRYRTTEQGKLAAFDLMLEMKQGMRAAARLGAES